MSKFRFILIFICMFHQFSSTSIAVAMSQFRKVLLVLSVTIFHKFVKCMFNDVNASSNSWSCFNRNFFRFFVLLFIKLSHISFLFRASISCSLPYRFFPFFHREGKLLKIFGIMEITHLCISLVAQWIEEMKILSPVQGAGAISWEVVQLLKLCPPTKFSTMKNPALFSNRATSC